LAIYMQLIKRNLVKRAIFGALLAYSFFVTQNIALAITAQASSASTFTRNLSLRSSAPEVKSLQIFLNSHGFTVARSGAGSLGNETSYFGLATYRSVVNFQKSQNILATGYFGPLSLAHEQILLFPQMER